MFDKPSICSACQGACCKRHPGAAYPADFGLPDETKLRAALASGLWTLDWWEGDPREGIANDDSLGMACYVRLAIAGHEGQKRHASWGGQCALLTPDGCSLPSDDRPLECKSLEPVARETGGFNCKMRNDVSKQNACIAWLEYADLLAELAGD